MPTIELRNRPVTEEEVNQPDDWFEWRFDDSMTLDEKLEMINQQIRCIRGWARRINVFMVANGQNFPGPGPGTP